MTTQNPSPIQIPAFDGVPVASTSIAVTNAGDGLSKAMKVDPRVLHIGDTVFIVLECIVTKVAHAPIAKDESNVLTRVHTCSAGVASFIDRDQVSGVLEQARVKMEQAKGIDRLPLDDPEATPIDDLLGDPDDADEDSDADVISGRFGG